MALWKELKRQLIKDTPEEKQDPISGLVFNQEAENPTPRENTVAISIIKEVVPAPLKLGPLGSSKAPRGALNPLKLLVTVYVLLNLCGAAFLLSNNLTITVAALCVFVPNAAFLMLLRSKL